MSKQYNDTQESIDAQRRQHLKQGIALALASGTAGLMAPPLWAAGSESASASSSGGTAAGETLFRKIPASGESLPAVGMGSSRTFNANTNSADQMGPLRQVLSSFYQLGGRVIDTSPMYGRSEAVLGKLAADLQITDKLFWATKVWTNGREAGIEQMQRSMDLLGTQAIDLIQVHNLRDTATHLKTLRGWQEQGRVRYIGITHHDVSAFDGLELWMKKEPLDFVQLNYSVATPDAEQRLLPLAAERGIAVLVNEPFEKGSLFRATRGQELPEWATDFADSWAQFFLKYVASNPHVTCPIPATSKPKHMRDNMGALTGPLPDEKTRQRMRETIAAL